MPAKPREEPSTTPVPRADEATVVAQTAEGQHEAGENPAAQPQVRGDHAVALAAKLPVTAIGAVAGDISSAARRPDALLYWGGLVGLAALGVLDWPVAAAIGVGVAVAHGVRHSRA